jgi:type II secretion system protein H
MRHRGRDNFGFTLIELVVVLTIITIALGMAAPSLRGWSDGAKLRDAADQFIATTQYARNQAVLSASEIRITFDSSSTAYALERRTGTTTEALAGDWGQASELPIHFSIQVISGGENGAIVFHSDARSTPAVVRITSARGEIVDIASSFPAASFARLEATP